jgi:hypothetical protein
MLFEPNKTVTRDCFEANSIGNIDAVMKFIDFHYILNL